MITDAKEIYITEYPEIREIYKEHEKAHWLEDDPELDVDVEQWKSGVITDKEKALVKMILRLFTQSDKDVSDAYHDKLIPAFKHPDFRFMFSSFASREATHTNSYKLLNDTLGYDSEDFMSEFLSYSEMKDKHDFMIAEVDLSTDRGKAVYLAKQVLMEGVNLFASFAMLLSFKQAKPSKLPGTVSINKWSQIDESWHVLGLVGTFKRHVEENPSIVDDSLKLEIYNTAREVVKLEDDFVDLCFSVGDTDCIDKEDLKQYIRFVCDYRMQQLGLKAQFDVKENPLKWIDDVTGNTLGNFFETTITEYSKANLTGDWVYPSNI